MSVSVCANFDFDLVYGDADTQTQMFLRDKDGKVFMKEADKVYSTYEEAERALKERDKE